MKPKHSKAPAAAVVKDIRRATRMQYSAEEKIRIVLEGLRGEDSIAELCRKEGIAQGVYYKWSKDFMEAGKRRLAGDTSRAATTDEVRDLRRGWASPGLPFIARMICIGALAKMLWSTGNQDRAVHGTGSLKRSRARYWKWRWNAVN